MEVEKNREKNPEEILSVEEMSVSYGKKCVLHEISFRLHRGGILVIVGESGSGKSTILKAAQGLLGTGGRISGGSIRLCDRDITHIDTKQRRKLAGVSTSMIFQNAGASFCPIRTIGDQIYEAVREHKDWSREEFRRRVKSIMEHIHLTEAILDEYPFRLSGGMGQRAGILAAMILEPKLLLADEPTSALDTVTQVSVVKELMGLRKNHGISIVMVTHHMGVAWYMADHILVIRKGKMVEFGTKRQIFEHPRETYTQELIHAVPRLQKQDWTPRSH